MKGLKKCFGVLLACFIMAGTSLSIQLDVSALKHEYMSIPLMGYYLPTKNGVPNVVLSSGHYVYDWDFSHADAFDSSLIYNDFSIGLTGSAYDSSLYDDLEPKLPSSVLITNPQSDESFSSFTYNNLVSLYSRTIYTGNPSGFYISASNYTDYVTLYPSEVTNLPSYLKSKTRNQFDQNGVPTFNLGSVSSLDNVSCSPFSANGCPSALDGRYGLRTYLTQSVLPYSYSADSFYVHSTAIDTDGIHYNHSFSFSDMFSGNIGKFSYLSIPLWDFDGYFMNSSNLTENREIEFKGVFEFDQSFTFNPNLSENGSSSYVKFVGTSADTGLYHEQDIPCLFNQRQVSDLGVNWLEYSCHGFLDDNYILAFPAFIIDGNNEYFFLTSGDWRFANSYLVTDNDETAGTPFGTDPHGNYVPADANNDIQSDEADFFQSLLHLFNFTFINPFAPLFQMFAPNDSCVQIPIIAGMLHSQETQVCPFFDSNTRQILTPVFTLSSLMLIFGFAVRWLGSSSGNLFEDGAVHQTDHFNIGRRKRK